LGAKRIARTLGIARNTVRRYLAAGGPVAYRQPQRSSVLDGHAAWLRERFLQHRGNCDVVRQQLSRELGIETSLRTVERAPGVPPGTGGGAPGDDPLRDGAG
jgi:transposase